MLTPGPSIKTVIAAMGDGYGAIRTNGTYGQIILFDDGVFNIKKTQTVPEFWQTL